MADRLFEGEEAILHVMGLEGAGRKVVQAVCLAAERHSHQDFLVDVVAGDPVQRSVLDQDL